ncbi:MAG: glyoxalase/bleomycin resistance/dioxygenase family protein [Ignavibacteriae bacterium]|nr:glyoxalase/bleomycin resistance/dioxygenase family protein [Ignavibacteriota bacterium]
MKFHSSVIFVDNVEIAKDFYIGVLNQEIEHDFGKNVILKGGLTIWEVRPEHVIGKSLETNGKSNRFELYFETDLIEEVYKKLIKGNTEFLHKIHEEPWGQRTFRFFDPDKHLVEVGEPLETFVMNMKNKGLSIEQIVEKSGIPHETVTKITS